MKKILLILSFLRSSPKAIEEAVQLAKENQAELIVSFVIDVEHADKIAHRLADEGWIGGRPSEQFYISLLREYKLQAENQIHDIEKRARAVGVPVRSAVKSGSFLTETLRLADLEEPDLIIVTRRKRSGLSRLIFGSVVKTLQKQVRCEVRVIDAE